MNKPFTLLLLLNAFLCSAQTEILREDFTGYEGNSTTAPTGWGLSYHGSYTSSGFSGPSGPNAYKFGEHLAEITSPEFVDADSLSFWIKGNRTDSLSYMYVVESKDSTAWDTLTIIQPVPKGITLSFPVKKETSYIRLGYNKSKGNVAIDDISITATTTSLSQQEQNRRAHF